MKYLIPLYSLAALAGFAAMAINGVHWGYAIAYFILAIFMVPSFERTVTTMKDVAAAKKDTTHDQ